MKIGKLGGPRVEIFHNILWSKYKGGVFSALYQQARLLGLRINFVQIAETQGSRTTLSKIDLTYHTYPFDLLFEGAYEAVWWPRLAARLFMRVLTSKAELVILPCYDTFEYWLMLLAAIIGRKKRAVFCDSTALDNPQTTLKSFLKRMFFRFCDGFFAYGKRSGDYLNMHGVPHPRIFTRCQSAALPHDYTPQKALELRLKNWPNAQEPRVLYVGRLDEEKRIDTLISAFGIVLSRYPNAKLAIVGAGRLESALQEQSNALGLHASAMWLGSMGIEQLQFQYAASTCLVLPSQSEPWGLVVNEALSYGCPVIVSDRCGCIPELVLDSVTGFAFPIGNAEELANRIVRSVVEFSQRVEIAKSCIEHMASFTPDAAAEQMLQGCRKLLNT